MTGDTVDGGDRRLRVWLEEQAIRHGMAVKCTEPVWTLTDRGPGQVAAQDLIAQVEPAQWLGINAGDGSKGRRLYDGVRVPLWRWAGPPRWALAAGPPLPQRPWRAGLLCLFRPGRYPAGDAGAGGGLPVAGDGTILRGIPVEGSLPKIETRGAPHGNRLTDAAALRAARIAGAAPAALRPRLDLIEARAQDGIVVQMRDGPELIFGDATRARAKWIAATRVLADPEAEGASYIDVRLPGRPAAGGLPAGTVTPVAPAGTAETAPPAGTTEVDPAT